METPNESSPLPYYRPEEPSIEAEHPGEPGFFVTIADCGKSRTLEPEQMQANARLISAIPDLLDACQFALTFCESAAMLNRQAFDSCAWETIRDAAKLRSESIRAALAKPIEPNSTHLITPYNQS